VDYKHALVVICVKPTQL